MRISFVIPAYNEEAVLAQCLTSVRQELQNEIYDAEIIVVNNASTDRTKEVAERFSGIRIIDEPRKGLTRARQTGLEAATGDLIANVDADVMLPPGWLVKVVREFSADPKLVALSGPFIYYDLSSFVQVMVGFFYGIAFLLHLFNQYILRMGAMLQGGNFVLRRNVLLAVGGFDTSIEFYGEDTDIARRMSRRGKVLWTFKLPVYSSGRRLKGEGVLYMSLKYTLNYFSVTFFGRPVTRTHKDIRPPKTDL